MFSLPSLDHLIGFLLRGLSRFQLGKEARGHQKVGQQLLEDEELGPNFLQPLKSQGVLRVEESALIIRMKFAAVPGEQWVIRREAYRRVRDALRKEGIRFAHREVMVRLPDGKSEGGNQSLTEAAGVAVGTTLLASSEIARQSDPDMR